MLIVIGHFVANMTGPMIVLEFEKIVIKNIQSAHIYAMTVAINMDNCAQAALIATMKMMIQMRVKSVTSEETFWDECNH